jgi:hypothetical protein
MLLSLTNVYPKSLILSLYYLAHQTLAHHDLRSLKALGILSQVRY